MSLGIFQLRNIAQPLVKYVIGNGQNTFLWLDFWHPIGPLFQHASSLWKQEWFIIWKDPLLLGFSLLSLMLGGYGQEIMNASPPDLTPHTNEDDRVVLLPSSSQVHTSKSAWEAVRVVKPVVPWARQLAWYSQRSYSSLVFYFVVGVSRHGRLSTKDRLAAWGVIVEDSCVLCSGSKSHSHLFFECHFSSAVWGYFMKQCGHNSYHCVRSNTLDWLN